MLAEQIDSDLKAALKDRNEVVRSSLRNLKAAIKNTEIEKGHSLSEDEVLAVVAKKVKQHKDSIESFTAGNRADLAKIETDQMAILQKYLPKQMDEAEVAEIVKASIATLNARLAEDGESRRATTADFGKVMKDVVAKVKGQADGSLISKLVKENLK